MEGLLHICQALFNIVYYFLVQGEKVFNRMMKPSSQNYTAVIIC